MLKFLDAQLALRCGDGFLTPSTDILKPSPTYFVVIKLR
jgi:hypothetical protein